MSTENDVARSLRSWLREERHEDADRVLDVVFDQVPATPQRRVFWSAQRFTDMNTYTRVAITAAAVLIVAMVGFALLPRNGGPGVDASPSPSPSPTVHPTPSPTPGAYVFPAQGELAIRRHSLTVEGISFSVDVPVSGWVSDGAHWFTRDTGVTPDGAAILFWSPDNVFADPCAHTPLSPPVGPSAADFAAAVSQLPGTDDITAATDIAAVFGSSAKYRQLIVREDAECPAEDFYLWYNQGEGDDCAGTVVCQRYATELGSEIRLWIVVRDGSRLVIEAESYEGAGPGVEALIQQIVDSTQFE